MWQSRDPEGRKQRKLHFSTYKQLTDHDPNQMAGLENPEKHTEAPQCGERSAQAPQHRGRALGTKTRAHKPRDTEVRLRGLREAHTSLCDAEGTRKDPRKPLPSKLWQAVQGRTGE